MDGMLTWNEPMTKWLCLPLFLVGCLSSSPAQDASTTNREHATKRLIEFFNAFADAIVSAHDDCALVVSRLSELLDINKALLDELHKPGSVIRRAAEQPAQELQELRTRRWPEIERTWTKCRNEKGINEFVMRVVLDDATSD
jgi:hypothetical protein